MFGNFQITQNALGMKFSVNHEWFESIREDQKEGGGDIRDVVTFLKFSNKELMRSNKLKRFSTNLSWNFLIRPHIFVTCFD